MNSALFKIEMDDRLIMVYYFFFIASYGIDMIKAIYENPFKGIDISSQHETLAQMYLTVV